MQRAPAPGEHSSACVINNTCTSSAIPAPWTKAEDGSSCYTGDRFGLRGFYFRSWGLPSSCRGRGMAVRKVCSPVLGPCTPSFRRRGLLTQVPSGSHCSHWWSLQEFHEFFVLFASYPYLSFILSSGSSGDLLFPLKSNFPSWREKPWWFKAIPSSFLLFSSLLVLPGEGQPSISSLWKRWKDISVLCFAVTVSEQDQGSFWRGAAWLQLPSCVSFMLLGSFPAVKSNLSSLPAPATPFGSSARPQLLLPQPATPVRSCQGKMVTCDCSLPTASTQRAKPGHAGFVSWQNQRAAFSADPVRPPWLQQKVKPSPVCWEVEEHNLRTEGQGFKMLL